MRRSLSAAFHRVTGLLSTRAAAAKAVALPGKFQEYKAKAEQEDAEAQFNRGFCYDAGRGVAKDYAEAVKWYRKAAEQGHTDAQFNLGVCYAHGQGVATDKVEAYAWFSMAAKADSDAAKSRDLLRKELTPQQFTDAQKRMKELRWQIAAKLKSSTP
ncbi:MAG: tetratricopeptide repeat protein [Verrucomicrobiota bacterium]